MYRPPRAAAHAPGGYGIRPYRRGRRPRRPADVHRAANIPERSRPRPTNRPFTTARRAGCPHPAVAVPGAYRCATRCATHKQKSPAHTLHGGPKIPADLLRHGGLQGVHAVGVLPLHAQILPAHVAVGGQLAVGKSIDSGKADSGTLRCKPELQRGSDPLCFV